jgi:hypothetical protein
LLVITICHYVKTGRVDDARARILSNTEGMARLPGFLFRHTGSPGDAPEQIITVTAWRSAADRDRWDAIKGKIAYPPNQVDLYERWEIYEAEVFDARWSAEFTAAERLASAVG